MTITSMRQWLAVLAEEKLLRVVSRKVSLQHELAAVGKQADGRGPCSSTIPKTSTCRLLPVSPAAGLL